MPGADLSTRDGAGHVVVVLSRDLDIANVSAVAAGLAVVTAREPWVVMDLAGQEFIDCSGVAMLALGQEVARHAGGELLLAAPQRRVLRSSP